MGLDPFTLMAGSSLVGGLLGAGAAGDAADAQVQAANQATASQRAIFDKQVQLQQPFLQAGTGALQKLSYLMGVGGQGGAGAAPGPTADELRTQLLPQFTKSTPGDSQYYSTEGGGFYAPGAGTSTVDEAGLQAAIQQHMAQQQQGGGLTDGGAGGGYGSLLKQFGMGDFQLDPGIQFQTKMGNQALTNSNAAKNGTLSGSALKDLIGFNQGMAGTGYQSAFDRYMQGKGFTLGSLMDFSKLGQAAASNSAANGAGYASSIGNSIMGAGQSAAAGITGTANALSGGLGGVGNAYFLSSLLGKNNPNQNPGGVLDSTASQFIQPTA